MNSIGSDRTMKKMIIAFRLELALLFFFFLQLPSLLATTVFRSIIETIGGNNSNSLFLFLSTASWLKTRYFIYSTFTFIFRSTRLGSARLQIPERNNPINEEFGEDIMPSRHYLHVKAAQSSWLQTALDSIRTYIHTYLDAAAGCRKHRPWREFIFGIFENLREPTPSSICHVCYLLHFISYEISIHPYLNHVGS